MAHRVFAVSSALSLALALSFAAQARAEARFFADYTPSDRPKGRGSIALFNTDRAHYGAEAEFGMLSVGQAGSNRPRDLERGSWELALRQTIYVAHGPFFLSGTVGTLLRDIQTVDVRGMVWSTTYHSISTGLRLGLIEPEATVGFSLITLDTLRGRVGFEMLSPRVGAGVGLQLGRLRGSIGAFSEYLWRWSGPDLAVRGAAIALRLDFGRPKTPIKER